MSEQDLMAKKIFEVSIKFYKAQVKRQIEKELKHNQS